MILKFWTKVDENTKKKNLYMVFKGVIGQHISTVVLYHQGKKQRCDYIR